VKKRVRRRHFLSTLGRVVGRISDSHTPAKPSARVLGRDEGSVAPTPSSLAAFPFFHFTPPSHHQTMAVSTPSYCPVPLLTLRSLQIHNQVRCSSLSCSTSSQPNRPCHPDHDHRDRLADSSTPAYPRTARLWPSPRRGCRLPRPHRQSSFLAYSVTRASSGSGAGVRRCRGTVVQNGCFPRSDTCEFEADDAQFSLRRSRFPSPGGVRCSRRLPNRVRSFSPLLPTLSLT
jgi:hypothetical protein